MRKRSGLLLVGAWVSGLIGLILGILLEPLWFARFGSVVVLLALMGEYSLIQSQLARLYSQLEKVEHDDDMPDLTPSKWHRKKVLLSHITIVFGTLIWGFGDLLL